jgi:hypothetical protein
LDSLDRLNVWFDRLVNQVTQRLVYAGTFPYVVVSCNALAQTVNVASLTAQQPPLTDVPLRSPGVVLDLLPGTQVRVGYDSLSDGMPYVVVAPSGGLTIPGGSGIKNTIDAGYILILQLPGTPFTVTATYFPAGVAGGTAAEAAHLLAPGSILLHLDGGRVQPSGWTVP